MTALADAATNLPWARFLMGTTLGLHIIFAMLGIGLPLVVAVVHAIGLARRDERYLVLARSLTRLVVLLFAIGAATGIVISFELSLLWPRFMAIAGPVVAAAFAVELIAFFLEAIFLALYVYGRERIRSAWLHWSTLIPVCFGAVMSGVLITLINGWMNVPAGFSVRDGAAVDVDPATALLRTSTVIEVSHLAVTSYLFTAGMVAGTAGLGVLLKRGRPGQAKLALEVSLALAAIVSVPVVITGDLSAKQIGQDQPEKLAVAEALFHSQSCAPETIGGIVVGGDDPRVVGGIGIPCLLSWLDHDDVNATVAGLDRYPQDTWPPLFLHYTFDLMVGVGFLATAYSTAAVLAVYRRRRRARRAGGGVSGSDLIPDRGWMIWGAVAMGPLTLVAMECGWILTCVGRQPWVIYHVMTTAEAVTDAPGLPVIAVAFFVLWAGISAGTLVLVRRLLRHEERGAPAAAAGAGADAVGA